MLNQSLSSRYQVNFLSQMQEEIVRTIEFVSHLQTKWPIGISLDLGRNKIYYDCLPYLFLSAFPSLDLDQIRSFNIAVRLFASSIFVYDKVMDRQDENCSIEYVLRGQAMQLESYRQLQQLFNSNSIFWERFQKYVADYADACLQEQAFQSGKRSWNEYTEEVSIKIAMNKGGVAKAAIAGLADLAGEDRWLETLSESLDLYSLAFQMIDDLEDWKEDVQRGIPSLLISRLLDRPPQIDPNELAFYLDRLSRKIYYEGHAGYTLNIAIESLDRAVELLKAIPELLWQSELIRLRHKCESLSNEIHKIITSNIYHARQKTNITISEK
jgi:squalene-hopene/tetraprenyl-beta-curcumene cyclase